MGTKRANILLLAPSAGHEYIGQRGLPPQAGRNHLGEPNAADGRALVVHGGLEDRAGTRL